MQQEQLGTHEHVIETGHSKLQRSKNSSFTKLLSIPSLSILSVLFPFFEKRRLCHISKIFIFFLSS